MLAYWVAGMPPFEAVCHAMTTIATGGFSTSDESIAHYNSQAIENISIIFMLIGSKPFVLYLQALQGKGGKFFTDSQVRWFLGTIVVLICILAFFQVTSEINPTSTAVREASFNVVSILTGTGYVTTDYGLWGGFAVVAFFCIMFIGGCAGSTSCGIKIFRFEVIFEALKVQLQRMIHPHGVFSPRYNGQALKEDVVSSVASFFFLFFVCFGILAIALSALGLDTLTALSSAGTAIANVGPGLGDVVGPNGTFKDLPDGAKWLMSLGMLLGRLELFTVLVLFTPTFWRI
jgi:trk system potassium uptake protein TrkH